MRASKRLMVGLLVAVMVMGGGIAYAQPKETPKEADPFHNLGLSADQRGKLTTANSERLSALTALQQKIVEMRKKLMGLLFDKKASDKEIDQVVNQLEAADKEALLAQVKFHKTLRQLLNQEQLNTLNKGNK